jgi:very-short-patch-repair endonuclease
MRGADPAKSQRARALRRAETEAEQAMWRALRGRRLAAFKFVRQAPIGPYFADFACRRLKLVIEIDCATHSSDQELAYDSRREDALRRRGYRVLRFQNDDVRRNLEGVLETVLATLQEAEAPLTPTLSP